MQSAHAPLPLGSDRLKRAVAGCILGTAVGDSVGLPMEGLSRRRVARICGAAPLRQQLLLGRGMISDDTEHTCMVAQALLASDGDPDAFARSLAWRFRGWLAGLPAGVGMATLRAIVRLWLGRSWRSSGVYSAGNGPAMRAVLLGVYAHADPGLLDKLVHCCTRITHTDPRAEEGAWLVALAARHALLTGGGGPDHRILLAEGLGGVRDPALRQSIRLIETCLDKGETVEEFADRLGVERGVGGFVVHTVPVCLFCWLRHSGDFRAGVEAAIRLGGDTDSTGAIVGALLGTQLGPEAIPADWLARLVEWPRSPRWMARLAAALADSIESGRTGRPLRLFWPALIPRNLLFLIIVLAHGFRRLLPPY